MRGAGPCRAFSNHEPKPDIACDISIFRAVGPARPASFQLHRSCVLPSMDYRDIMHRFVFLSVTSSSRFRGRTCSFANTQRLLWRAPRCPQSVYENGSAIYPLNGIWILRWVAGDIHEVPSSGAFTTKQYHTSKTTRNKCRRLGCLFSCY